MTNSFCSSYWKWFQFSRTVHKKDRESNCHVIFIVCLSFFWFLMLERAIQESYSSHWVLILKSERWTYLLQVVMLTLILIFAIVHSGLASLRDVGEKLIGERAFRVLFAGTSLPLAVSTVVSSLFWSTRTSSSKFIFMFVSVSFVSSSLIDFYHAGVFHQPQIWWATIVAAPECSWATPACVAL